MAIDAVALAGIDTPGAAQKTKAAEKAVNLFDGATLNGWKASNIPTRGRSRTARCRAMASRRTSSTSATSSRRNSQDFEAEFEVRTHTGANSGVYFHTAWQDSGWPVQGFEMQNNHQPHFPGDTGATYIENKKTGSLSGVRNAYKRSRATTSGSR